MTTEEFQHGIEPYNRLNMVVGEENGRLNVMVGIIIDGPTSDQNAKGFDFAAWAEQASQAAEQYLAHLLIEAQAK